MPTLLGDLCLGCHLRDFACIARDNEALPEKSDREMRARLESCGLTVGRGEVFESNQCLADSLLQLAIHSNLVPKLKLKDRSIACMAAREYLWNVRAKPRNAAGVPEKKTG